VVPFLTILVLFHPAGLLLAWPVAEGTPTRLHRACFDGLDALPAKALEKRAITRATELAEYRDSAQDLQAKVGRDGIMAFWDRIVVVVMRGGGGGG
jgi:hypothetical protein